MGSERATSSRHLAAPAVGPAAAFLADLGVVHPQGGDDADDLAPGGQAVLPAPEADTVDDLIGIHVLLALVQKDLRREVGRHVRKKPAHGEVDGHVQIVPGQLVDGGDAALLVGDDDPQGDTADQGLTDDPVPPLLLQLHGQVPGLEKGPADGVLSRIDQDALASVV